MAKKFTFQAAIDTSQIAQDTQRIRNLIEVAFAPVQFKLPDFSQSAEIEKLRAGFTEIATVDMTKPLDDLQAELSNTEAQMKRLDAQLQETFIKGGLPKHSQEYNNLIADYQKKQKDNFGTSGNALRIGDLRKEFVDDTAAAADIGNFQAVVKELQEKQKFTIAEQKQQIELEIQIEAERARTIQLQRAISQKELQQLEQQIGALSQAEQDSGARELLQSAYQEYEATSKRLIEEEMASLKALDDRKKRIAALEVKAAPVTTSERVTALTVTKASVENAEKLTQALKEAAVAQDKLAEATKQTAAARNDTGLQFEKQRLEIQRRNAQIAAQLVEQEKSAGAEKRAEIEREIIARKEAAAVATQTARAETNERTAAARASTAEVVEAEKRTTAEIVEEQKRRTAAFKQELAEQSAANRQAKAAEARASGSSGGLAKRVDGIANLLTGGLQAFATVQLVRQISNVTSELDTLRVEAARSKVSLDILSGSSSNAAARIAAIQQAGNGTINTLTAIQIGVQATALGIANTTEEFGRLTTAARAVTLVSPVIKDINGALAEISLAGANESYRRLDQLGLGVLEVKEKIAELQAADKSLSDQQAFSTAVIETLNTKYGKLLSTTEAQASGQEQLTTAFTDFKAALADTAAIRAYDGFLGDLAESIQRVRASMSDDFSFFGTIDALKEKQAELNGTFVEGATLFENFKNAIGGDLEAPSISSPTQAKEIDDLIALSDKLNELQSQGVVTSDRYRSKFTELAAAVNLNTDASKSYAVEIYNLASQIEAAKNIQDASTSAGKLYADAQQFLGKEFISSDESAKDLVVSLEKVQAEYNQSGNLRKYEQGIADIREGFYHLTSAAADYRKELDAKKRVEIIGDAEQNFVATATDQAAQLIESGVSYDDALDELNRKKAAIKKFFEDFPTDIKPEEIPLVLAKFKVELDGDPATVIQQQIATQRETLLNLVQNQADALVESGAPIDEAMRYLLEQKGRVKAFIASLPEDIRPEELLLRVSKFKVDFESGGDPFADLRQQIEGEVASQVDTLAAGGLSIEGSLDTLRNSKNEIDAFFASLPEGISDEELAVRLAKFNQTLSDGFAQMQEQLSLSDIHPDLALGQINDALSGLDVAILDNVPGIQAYREELSALFDDIAASGQVTNDQAARLSELQSITSGIAGDTSYFGDAVAGLNSEFIDGSSEAQSLLGAIAALEGQYASGQIEVDNYAGQMVAFIDRLIEVAKQAGITGDALNNLLDIKAQASTFVINGSTGFADGQKEGDSKVKQIELANAANTRREEARLAEKASREWEKAAREAESAAQRASQAFESSLQNVPGLFGTSSVTQEQLDLAAAGIPQNFADDFVRRLEDVVVNKKQRSDVSVDQARTALQNINVQTEGLTEDQILQLIKQAWKDSSLFANPENLSLINADAVKANLDLQKKAEEGRQNIIDYLGKTFDVNVAALTGGSTTAGASGKGATPDQQQAAALAQQKAQATLALQVDEDGINAAATKSAQLFEKVFVEYDFSQLALAPANAMVASLTTDSIAALYKDTGRRAADLVQAGFTGRVTELEWLNSLRDAFYNDLVTDTTGAVLSALGG